MQLWGIKIVAAAVLTICGMFAGRALASSYVRRVSTIRGARDAIKQLELKMLQDMLPVGEALRTTGYEPFILTAQTLKQSSLNVEAAWLAVSEKLFAHGGALDCLEPDDKSALDTLFRGLGLTGRAEQKVLIDQVETALAQLEVSARERANELSKLHTTLGVLAGIALSIALL